ncbi:helix-turn-helix domain-containing protein [Methylobacterium sp. NI91]|nr:MULTISPECIES: helix-turn-helix domain-containing protein [unclassified Methylobacterium]QIJ73310.1 helix-turn-helix domain-containing protein [Methylobacterium sp. CLZ]QIJ78214.1 helix-turn-helix domain-containing protein [Methylobacterium sp. NI91]
MIEHRKFGEIADPKLRREAWIESAAPLYRTDIDRDVPVRDDVFIRNFNLGTCILGKSIAPEMYMERSLEQISRQSLDHISFRLFLSGTSDLHVDGRSSVLRAGDLQMLDLSQWMRSTSHGSKPVIHLIVPRRLFEKRLGDMSAFHGSTIRPDASPLTRLMTDHMRSLAACIDAADEGQRTALTAATVSMVNAVLTKPGDGPYERDTVLGVAMRRFIEDDLRSFDLGIEKLCARFAISRTRLYTLFEADGGVASYIRDRRLARAMRILAGLEAGDRRRVSTVGYACGFETEKLFSRAFKRKYGVNPSEVDAGYRPQARLEYGATLMSWINAL